MSNRWEETPSGWQYGPVPKSVFDPDLGSDGGGAPEVEPVPTFGEGEFPQQHSDELTACPTCGTGVHPNRIRD